MAGLIFSPTILLMANQSLDLIFFDNIYNILYILRLIILDLMQSINHQKIRFFSINFTEIKPDSQRP